MPLSDEDRLSPHEAASVMNDALKNYMADTGATQEQAVAHFNRVAEKLGIKMRVSLVGALKD